jgi:hypothetical protein
LAFNENIRTTARLSDGNVVDKTGDEESPRELRIGLQGGDINGHGLIGSAMAKAPRSAGATPKCLASNSGEWARQVMPQSL